jgi:predicted anti-sigma-YlaC factor YlaD
MRCNRVRQALSEARYQGGAYPPSVAEHLTRCQACREFAHASARLDAFLQLDQPIAPRPGFDTRFFARLSEIKAKQAERKIEWRRYPVAGWVRQWRWVLGGVSLACAVVAILVARQVAEPRATSGELAPLIAQDIGLVRDLDFIRELDLVSRLQEVETFEVLAKLDLSDIERAGQAVAAEHGGER